MDALETRVLVIDDEKSIRDSIGALLEDNNMLYLGVESGEAALEILEKDQKFHTILLDVWLKTMDGFEVLEKLFQKKLDIPVIMMTGHGNIEMAVQATKKGAYDFLEKPFSTERLILLIQHARKENALILENRHLKSNQGDLNLTIIGKSKQIQEVRDFIAAAAVTDAKVSIYGENGTGKELVAKNIHALSARKKYPWVAVNSAAIPDELIESELFGHEKGSFTSAIKQTMGKFELANKGTLFLDEIGDMSLKTQAKILRVLQEGVFTRVGGSHDIQVDVRVIAATNKDLTKEIAKGNFREDLYYRIHILPIVIPPLRERQEDLELLIDQFMEQLKSIRSKVKSFDPSTLEILKAYPWPGNIRELKNLVERLLILVQEPVILPRHLPYSYFKQATGDSIPLSSQPAEPKDLNHLSEKPLDLNSARKNFEESYIRKSLTQNLWNISKTAKALGLERSYLHKKMKLYNLAKDQEG